ncbi:hypothetical protein [Kitasatospora camelliae]|uniref:Uncharacterized protein n=1 Tax=Kitasatospora camelliae TaxID=3156397 RepID=A0AAU8JWZ7_9ACTN
MIDDTTRLAPVPPGPQPATARPSGPPSAPPPVFVDSSGRRQRRVRRLGRLLAVPAVGYLALVLSSLLGGPAIDAPFLPQPPARPADTLPGAAPTASEEAAGAEPTDDATGQAATRRPTPAGTGQATTVRPAATAVADPPTTPNPAPTSSRGKPTEPNAHKPTKTP